MVARVRGTPSVPAGLHGDRPRCFGIRDDRGHLDSVDTFLAATGNTLHTALTSIETCAEGIVQRLSGEMFAKGEILEDAKINVREFVRLGREVLGSIEDYDNYGVELVELQTHIQGQFAARPLVHPEPLKLARRALREVQLRLWLTNAPLRHAFDALDSDPTSFDAAFRAYSSATLSAAWVGELGSMVAAT